MAKINYNAHKKVIEKHVKAAGKLLSVRTTGGVEIDPCTGMEIEIPDKSIEFYAVEDRYIQANTVQGVEAGDKKYYCVCGKDAGEIKANDRIYETSQIIISVQPVQPGGITTHFIVSTKGYGG